MVKFVLRKGRLLMKIARQVVLKQTNRMSRGTALHLVKKGRVDILKYLLESGANRNLMDHSKDSIREIPRD